MNAMSTMTTTASAAAGAASCTDALRGLREEKVALIEKVLALKATDYEYWKARHLNETQRITAVRIRVENAIAQGDAALAAVLQQRLAGHYKKQYECQTRIALVSANEDELRVMLNDEKRKLAHLDGEDSTASEEEGDASGDEPTAHVEEQDDESDLVRQMRSLRLEQDNSAPSV